MGAEKELEAYPSAKAKQPKEGTLASKIVDAMARRRKELRPWRGPLPAPRVSPPRTLGDVLASTKVRCKSMSPSKLSTPARPSPAPEMVQPSGSASCEDLGRDLGKMTDSNFEHGSTQKLDASMGPSPSKGPKRTWLSPSVPYRPTAGLVALFSRTGTRTQNPRALHSAASCKFTISYSAVATFAMGNSGPNQVLNGVDLPTGEGEGATASLASSTVVAFNSPLSTQVTAVGLMAEAGVGTMVADPVAAASEEGIMVASLDEPAEALQRGCQHPAGAEPGWSWRNANNVCRSGRTGGGPVATGLRSNTRWCAVAAAWPKRHG